MNQPPESMDTPPDSLLIVPFSNVLNYIETQVNRENVVQVFRNAVATKNYSLLKNIVECEQLKDLVKQLGPFATKTQFAAFITESITFIPNETIMLMLIQLVHITPLNGVDIVDFLEIYLEIFKNESPDVLRTCSSSLRCSIKTITDDTFQRLVTKFFEVFQPKRCSIQRKHTCLCFIIVVFEKVIETFTDTNKKLVKKYMNLFVTLSRDDDNVIKLRCAEVLLEWIENLPKDMIKEFHSRKIIFTLADETHESIRICTIDIMVCVICDVFETKLQETYFNKIIQIMTGGSLNIRKHIATKFKKIINFRNMDKIRKLFKEGFDDNELEVREIFANNLEIYCRKLHTCYQTNLKKFNKYLKSDIINLAHDILEKKKPNKLYLTVVKNLLRFSWILDTTCFQNNIYPIVTKISKTQTLEYLARETFKTIPNNIDWCTTAYNIQSVLQNIICTVCKTGKNSKLKHEFIISILQISQKCKPEHLHVIIPSYLELICDSHSIKCCPAILIFPLFLRYGGNNVAINIYIYASRFITKLKTKIIHMVGPFYMINELMFPTLDSDYSENIVKYLNVFQTYISKTEYTEPLKQELMKIFILSEKLHDVVSSHVCETDDSYTKFLQAKESVNQCNIYQFEQNLLENLKSNLQDGIFNIKPDQQNDLTYFSYLETVLILVYTVGLKSLEEIIKDKKRSPDQQNVARWVMLNIKTFSDIIREELKQSWVVTIKVGMSQKEINKINEETDHLITYYGKEFKKPSTYKALK